VVLAVERMTGRQTDGIERWVSGIEMRVSSPLTRFAPAPTGYLHIGHVVNAVFVWGLAKALGGRVLLRIEDHDRQRCRREFETALLEDLDWLGFVPDIYPSAMFRAGACDGRQSDRDAAYRAALAPLVAAGFVYACNCSRREIEESPGQSVAELRYPGTCRNRGLPLADAYGWRIRMDAGVERFDDVMLGPQAQSPAAQCGDVLIRDRLGNWTYQWAATVDDTLQGISVIIRGVDLLASTGRQIRLARLLGRGVPPVFAHHALVMKSPTQKVSKSDGDTGVRDLRAAGLSAADVIGRAAWHAGLQPEQTPVSAPNVQTLFR
jgi:glutamyl/glutaminyl-tRNA synthetase